MHKIVAGEGCVVNQDNEVKEQSILPQISLCIATDSSQVVQDLLTNAASFFGKYKIPWELSVVCSNEQDHEQQKIVFESFKSEHYQVRASVEVTSARAQRTWQALAQAHGRYRTLVDAGLNTPLADVLKMSQLLMEDSHLLVMFGNRYGMPKSKIREQFENKKIQRELTYTHILKEKQKTKLSDPFSDCLVIKDKAVQGLNPNLKGWYFSNQFEQLCNKHQIHYAEAPVHASLDKAELTLADRWHLFITHLF